MNTSTENYRDHGVINATDEVVYFDYLLGCDDDPTAAQIAVLERTELVVGCAIALIGAVGFLCNCVAIPVLLFGGKTLSGAFYKILAFLALFDNTFIFWSVTEAARKFFRWTSRWYLVLFVHFGFQVRAMAFLSSVLMTVVLALERYLAVTRPLLHLRTIQSNRPLRRITLVYVLPVLVTSVLFYLPKFFEAYVNEDGVPVIRDFRKDEAYVFWYVNVANLVVTGLIPLASLCLLNARIYHVIRKRWNEPLWTTSRTEATTTMGDRKESVVSLKNVNVNSKREHRRTAQQAFVLFCVVAAFVLSNILRVCLNLGEIFMMDKIKKRSMDGCAEVVPLWAHYCSLASEALLVANGAANLAIYAATSLAFRSTLARAANHVYTKIRKTMGKKVCQRGRLRKGTTMTETTVA